MWYLMKSKKKRLKKLVNGINVAVHSTNVDDGNENVFSFPLHGESAEINVHIIVKSHG